MKETLRNMFDRVLLALGYEGMVTVEFDAPKQESHGDLATNVALLLAKPAKKNPRAIAQEIVAKLETDPRVIAKVEIAGPGFINVTFQPTFFGSSLRTVVESGSTFGSSTLGAGKKAVVEYVSANPTGPLSVGHGRQAAIGDTIASLLEWQGYNVTREYYYNNAGRQMRVLGESTFARYCQLFDDTVAFPEDGYQGEYVRRIAETLRDERGKDLLTMPREEAVATAGKKAEESLFASIKTVLERMRVRHDVYFNEDSLYTSGKLEEVVTSFRDKGLAYDRDGAVWLKTSALGLEDDRVIIKQTGEPTYRLPDIAYHREKFLRGFDLMVDIFGADHIATIPDVLAGIEALGFDKEKVKVVIHQFVTLMRDGEQVKMSKRLANFVTLEDLLEEVGPDATRYFFLMRSIGTHLEFDLGLAKEQSEKNPVYYVQYAHARIASILRFAESEGMAASSADASSLGLLTGHAEVALAKGLLEFPDVVAGAARSFEPHRLPVYLHDVATLFHKFYHDHRIVTPEKDITAARLLMCLCTKTVLANGLSILGVSAPERM